MKHVCLMYEKFRLTLDNTRLKKENVYLFGRAFYRSISFLKEQK